MDALKNQPWNLSNQDAGLGGSALISGFPLFDNPVNPQNVASRSISTLTPPVSENDSPSPSNSSPDQMLEGGNEDPTLKRKASGNHLGSEPSNKSQHTESSSPDRHSAPAMTHPTRRRSLGHTPKDEQRLLKRKEQNRAAQRAFRERKEKHVKDLEDKVAELEARNEATQHENENLRDMLDRLQTENISLKQSGFTFSVQKNGETPSSNHIPSAHSIYSPVNSINTALVSPKVSNPLDRSSLTSFDPNILNILDDNITQPTTKDDPIQNLGGTYTGLPPNLSFRTIAENRMFMTPASVFDNLNDTANRTSVTPGVYTNNGTNDFHQFDLNSLPAWPGSSSNISSNPPEPLFDDLYAGYLSAITAQEFAPLSGTTPTLSPVTHQTTPASLVARSASIASPLPPSVLGADSLFTPPADSPPTDSDHSTNSTVATVAGTPAFRGQPPKSRSDCRRKIVESGDSIFAPPLQNANDNVRPMIKSNISTTEKNDRNVEILSAFTAMADPQFRNFDINNLCDEFKKKACCDRVLEPGVSELMENLSKSGVL